MKSDCMHIGVDVSKGKLDVYSPMTGKVVEFGNDAAGFRAIRDLARKQKAIVCCEPTGGYELEMVLFLQRFNVRVAYCDGYKVRHYARARGFESKNDRIDARMIASFASDIGVRIVGDKDRQQLLLRQRFGLYKTFMDAHVVLLQKASSESDPSVKKLLLSEAKRLQRRADDMLGKCEEIVGDNERMAWLFARFVAIDGVAAKTALAIIAWLPEIGTMKDGAITKLVGLAPKESQSGTTNHARFCVGGRKNVRCALYLATLSAVQYNHILKPYYQQVKLRMPGPKASKWAIVPTMRKLLHLMNRLAGNPDFELQKKPEIVAA